MKNSKRLSQPSKTQAFPKQVIISAILKKVMTQLHLSIAFLTLGALPFESYHSLALYFNSGAFVANFVVVLYSNYVVRRSNDKSISSAISKVRGKQASINQAGRVIHGNLDKFKK